MELRELRFQRATSYNYLDSGLSVYVHSGQRIDNPMAYKQCSRCHVEKDVEAFTKNGRIMSLCNPCREKFNACARDQYARGTGKTYGKQRDYRRRLFAEPVAEGFQRCVVCLNPKLIADFVAPEIGCGKSKKCFSCREYQKEHRFKYRIENQEVRLRDIARQRERQSRGRRKCFEHYGQQCVCCGENHYEFLTFDHVNNDGARHRSGIGTGSAITRWLIANHFPDSVQVLCWNCQWGKRLCGVCPHQKAKLE